jgi:hypothetical protein
MLNFLKKNPRSETNELNKMTILVTLFEAILLFCVIPDDQYITIIAANLPQDGQ